MAFYHLKGTITLLLLVLASVEAIPSFESRMETAKRILHEVPLIDGHNDVALTIRQTVFNDIENFPFHEDLKQIEPFSSLTSSATDLPRLKKGMVGGQFWAAYVPCKSQYKNAVTHALEQIDVIKRLVNRYPDDMQLVTTAQGILDAHKAGKIASLIGIEGGHSIDGSKATLRLMRELGVSYMSLTHSCNTPWADSAETELGTEKSMTANTGLSRLGRGLVMEMNRNGMMVDLSHVAAHTMEAALKVARAPVIFSHSGARAICDHPRNVPDSILRQTAANGGIVMVNFKTEFLTCSETANVNDIIAHINHIRRVAGIDHVGIGSDFNGFALAPDEIYDVSRFPVLIAEILKDPEWSEEDIKKLIGLNLIRVMSEVEMVTKSLVNEEPHDSPAFDTYPKGQEMCTNVWPPTGKYDWQQYLISF